MKGPLRDVVYIFEREGDHGGAYWLLVLQCGHSSTRSRAGVKHPLQAMTRLLLFRPLAGMTAPKRVKCFSCGLGQEKIDPAIAIAAFGGPKL